MKRLDITLTALALTALGCGSTTLDPIQGAAGSGGSGASGGSGGSGGSGATGGSGGSSGSSGSGGDAGTPACSTPNPAGCHQTGCPTGQVCEKQPDACEPTNCVCDPRSDSWGCTFDCGGGGTCVPDTTGADYFVRIGYIQGQEVTTDFCVAYELDSSNQPLWRKENALFAPNTLVSSDYAGLKKLTRYLPLKQRPVAFGKSQTLVDNLDTCSLVNDLPGGRVPSGNAHYFTFLSVPYSGEPDTYTVIADPGPGTPVQGLRVVNATAESNPIHVTADGLSLGELPFLNSPVGYSDTGESHLWKLTIKDTVSQKSTIIDYVGLDLLYLGSTTIFVSGNEFNGYTGLGCFDTDIKNPAFPKQSHCLSMSTK